MHISLFGRVLAACGAVACGHRNLGVERPFKRRVRGIQAQISLMGAG